MMHRWVLSWLVLGASLATTGIARAQTALPAAHGLTAEQLDSFVELTGDPKPLVWQRLVADPRLVPYAAAAADARLERRATGKTMTIVGFTILGIGVGAGYGLVLWGITKELDCTKQGNDDCHPNESLVLGGFGLMAASIAVGCAIGVPGIVRMVRASEAENEASARYQNPALPAMPAYPPSTSRLRMPGRTIGMPLLSVTF